MCKGENYFIDAKIKYAAAKRLNYDNALAQSKLYQIAGELEIAFIQFVKNGDTFYKALGYQFALDNYKNALRIKPNDPSLKQKINRCKRNLK